jgi:hypothetical protein
LTAALVNLFNDQDLDRLRVVRPSKVIFLCGGAIDSNIKAKPHNLRDYLTRYRPMRTPHAVVKAEAAIQVYRDSGYHDLITLEEDLAKIASIVLVIAESPGSLAELGAFASSEHIKPILRVVIQETNYKAESFVRFGPIQRIKNDRRDYIGVYPWRYLGNGRLVISSVSRHASAISKFINNHASSIPQSKTFADSED